MRIGELAAASGVPVKTLRFYDEVGLFRPCDDSAAIDAEHFVEILAPPPARGRIAARPLPSVNAAWAYSRDDENESQAAFAAVRAWLGARGLPLVAAKREMYWPGWLEIQFPVALG